MADAADSKSAEGNFMRVRLPPSAPDKNNPNQNGSDYFCLYSYFFSFHFSLFTFAWIVFEIKNKKEKIKVCGIIK